MQSLAEDEGAERSESGLGLSSGRGEVGGQGGQEGPGGGAGPAGFAEINGRSTEVGGDALTRPTAGTPSRAAPHLPACSINCALRSSAREERQKKNRS